MAKQETYKRGLDLDLFGQTRAFDVEEAQETRAIPFTISTEMKDRHGTVVRSDGWNFENFHRHPIVDFNHQATPSWFPLEDEHLCIIAKSSSPEIVEKEVRATATFATKEVNEKADQVFNMVLGGFIRAASVVFRPLERGYWGQEEEAMGRESETFYFPKVELYSWGPVTIPSNVGAGTRDIKPAMKDKAVNFAFEVLRQLCPEQIADEDIKKLSLGEKLDFTEEGIKRNNGGTGPTMEEQIAIQRQRLQLGNF